MKPNPKRLLRDYGLMAAGAPVLRISEGATGYINRVVDFCLNNNVQNKHDFVYERANISNFNVEDGVVYLKDDRS